ncbi:MAG TPA: zf-HC2 domain-containing protein [Terracidiphilus sp.]|nr:zf-HC2 domain-containing protein [Terracidiphilus sp.]
MSGINGCSEVRAVFTEYLDGRLNGREMQQIGAHLDACRACAREWDSLRQTQTSLAELGPVPAPEDLLLRIRVAVSQEKARSRRNRLEGLALAWKNTIGPFLLQASAGFASAVLLLGGVAVLVTMFAQPKTVQASADDPLGVASAPRLLYLSSGAQSDEIGASTSPIIVEAYVNPEGQVYDYRILSGPTDAITRSEVENMLLFSVFEPAKYFGHPVRGQAVLSFAGVAVRG